MKKLVAITLCLGAVSGLYAQDALVKQAKKLAGKPATIEEARGLIKQAISNPQTSNNPNTYMVAGDIELQAFNNGKVNLQIDTTDYIPKVKGMADDILLAYQYYMQALPLDSLPNKDGKVNPKNTKNIKKMFQQNGNDLFNVAAEAFNKGLYPEAYNTFILFADIPANYEIVDPEVFSMDKLATALYYGGVAAYLTENFENSADAFGRARMIGTNESNAPLYEIASWQEIAKANPDRAKEAQANIKEIAKYGIETFGIEKIIFVNNLINAMAEDEEFDQALAQLDELIAQYPETANLYGLKGFVYDRMNKDDLSEESYRKAASFENADFETLKSAAGKLFAVGTAKLNQLEGNSPEILAERQAIKENYFLKAKELVERAEKLKPGDSYMENLNESINYALETYF